MPAFVRAILIQESAEGGLSYKVKNPGQAARIKKVFSWIFSTPDPHTEYPLHPQRSN